MYNSLQRKQKETQQELLEYKKRAEAAKRGRKGEEATTFATLRQHFINFNHTKKAKKKRKREKDRQEMSDTQTRYLYSERHAQRKKMMRKLHPKASKGKDDDNNNKNLCKKSERLQQQKSCIPFECVRNGNRRNNADGETQAKEGNLFI